MPAYGKGLATIQHPWPVHTMIDFCREVLDFVQQLLIGPFERRSVRRYEGRRSVLLTTGESDEWRSQQAHSADAQHFPSGEKMRIATKVDARHGFSLLIAGGSAYFVISSVAGTPWLESGAIHKVTFAGSTANFCWSFQMANAFGPSRKVTFLVSPGARVMR